MQKYKKSLIPPSSSVIFLLSLHKFTYKTMVSKIKILSVLLILSGFILPIWADDYPSINPTVTFTGSDGETSNDESYSGSAPVKMLVQTNPENLGEWTPYYEWRIYQNSDTTAYIIRYEEDTEIEFNQSGTYRIILYAKFTKGEDMIEDTNADSPFTLTVSESNLQMPNAFSPNGDGINDIYKAKSGYKSLVEFHAYIFNRWGQKLFDWTDPAEGWDGTYNGKPVKDGVYFVLVKAKGADGKTYNIKKDVNLLRGYIESTSTSE